MKRNLATKFVCSFWIKEHSKFMPRGWLYLRGLEDRLKFLASGRADKWSNIIISQPAPPPPIKGGGWGFSNMVRGHEVSTNAWGTYYVIIGSWHSYIFCAFPSNHYNEFWFWNDRIRCTWTNHILTVIIISKCCMSTNTMTWKISRWISHANRKKWWNYQKMAPHFQIFSLNLLKIPTNFRNYLLFRCICTLV